MFTSKHEGGKQDEDSALFPTLQQRLPPYGPLVSPGEHKERLLRLLPVAQAFC